MSLIVSSGWVAIGRAYTLQWSDEVGFETLRLFQPFRRREALRAQEFRVEQPRLIARGGVAKHGDDGLARARVLRARRIAPATLTPDDRPSASPSSLHKAKAIVEAFRVGNEEASSACSPSRLAVTRPWPMPSVIELPSAFSSPVV